MPDKYLDEIISPFYSKSTSASENPFTRGRIYWTHFFFTHENLEFWRPKDYEDETKTSAKYFYIDTAGSDAFRRRAPLHTPKLAINEEFIVARAKKRPVILITPTPERVNIQAIRGGGRIHKNICLVAPLFSVEGPDGKAKFPSDFINRIRNMEYPHLFFMPESSDGQIKHSICRLDSMQAIFAPHLESTDLCISDAVVDILCGQIEYFMTNSYGGDYQVYREGLIAES